MPIFEKYKTSGVKLKSNFKVNVTFTKVDSYKCGFYVCSFIKGCGKKSSKVLVLCRLVYM